MVDTWWRRAGHIIEWGFFITINVRVWISEHIWNNLGLFDSRMQKALLMLAKDRFAKLPPLWPFRLSHVLFYIVGYFVHWEIGDPDRVQKKSEKPDAQKAGCQSARCSRTSLKLPLLLPPHVSFSFIHVRSSHKPFTYVIIMYRPSLLYCSIYSQK